MPRMEEQVLVDLQNSAARYESAETARREVLEFWGQLSAPHVGSFEVRGDAVCVNYLGLTAQAIGRFVRDEQDQYLVEYVFFVEQPKSDPVEVWRFYFDHSIGNDRGALYPDAARTGDVISQSGNTRVTTVICGFVAIGMRAKLFGPLATA